MPDAILISIKLTPGAPRNEVIGRVEGTWRIRVTAPPVEGKANKALLEFLSDKLDVAKSRLRLVGGEKSRHKLVAVEGLDEGSLKARLELG
jgi:uncharacterized protein